MAMRKLQMISSLAALAKQKVGTIDACKLRTATVTVRATYDGAAIAPVRLNIYTTPNKEEWDSVAADYFDVDFSAGATVQKTEWIAVPEEGEVEFEVENRDSAQAATDVSVWVSFERWQG